LEILLHSFIASGLDEGQQSAALPGRLKYANFLLLPGIEAGIRHGFEHSLRNMDNN
jgi:hypothetical protein